MVPDEGLLFDLLWAAPPLQELGLQVSEVLGSTYSLHCSSFLVNQNLYYRILTIKLVNQKKELQWRL